MMKALKKNQIVIFAIALMLVTAGYLNYTISQEQTAQTSSEVIDEGIAGIGDAKLVSTENIVNNTVNGNTTNNELNSVTTNSKSNTTSDTNNNEKDNQKDLNTSQTNTNVEEDSDSYFMQSRLERENMYSEMLASYQTILANSNISTEQKGISQNEISSINSQKNAVMIAENLIKNKGFKDVVIFVNNGSVSVVVKAQSLSEAEIAQIQSIVQRELNVNVENIHISNK